MAERDRISFLAAIDPCDYRTGQAEYMSHVQLNSGHSLAIFPRMHVMPQYRIGIIETSQQSFAQFRHSFSSHIQEWCNISSHSLAFTYI
jgi:hypothetical protein